MCKCKGCGETDTLKLGKLTSGEPSGGRETRLNIRLGAEGQAYMDRDSAKRIHKNTRRIAQNLADRRGGRLQINMRDLPDLRRGREEFVWQEERIHSILLEGIAAQRLI